MHSPLRTGAGKPSIKLNLQRFAKTQGLDLNAAMSGSSSDSPAQMLTYLNAASDSNDRVGAQDDGGVAIPGYHVVLDLFEGHGGAAPADQRAAVPRASPREVQLLGSHTMPIDVWIDSSGLVRRERLGIPLEGPVDPGRRLEITMTIDLFDFGFPVHVKAPPAGAVLDRPRRRPRLPGRRRSHGLGHFRSWSTRTTSRADAARSATSTRHGGISARAGSHDVGVSRIRVEPGAWSTPAHVEHGEEEIFYVLGGSGLSWQDEGPGQPPTTRSARATASSTSPSASCTRSARGPTASTSWRSASGRSGRGAWLPRAGMAWVGVTWTNVGEEPSPWEREAAAGSPDLPADVSRRPATS